MAISRCAASTLSLPWIRFIWRLMPKSPRIVPGAACRPLVGPIIVRITVTASGPSTTNATTGPAVMNDSSSG